MHRTTHPAERFAAGAALAETPPDEEGLSAEWMLSLRGQAGLGRPAFARLLGVSTPTIARLESGRASPRGALRRLLQLLRQHPSMFQQLQDVAPDS